MDHGLLLKGHFVLENLRHAQVEVHPSDDGERAAYKRHSLLGSLRGALRQFGAGGSICSHIVCRETPM